MISHRGISVITPLPFGEGTGEGPLPHMGISVITPLPFGGGEGGGANCLLVCEVTPTGLLVWGVESFFSHRAHRVHGGFWRTVSSPQKAFGIQRTQSVTAKVGCWVMSVRC